MHIMHANYTSLLVDFAFGFGKKIFISLKLNGNTAGNKSFTKEENNYE